jgi:hypothetical protein
MKLTGKIFLWILVLIVAVCVTVLVQNVDPKQRQPEVEVHKFADTLANKKYDLDSLRKIIGTNKGLPEGFEIAGAIAYSAFPELKDVEIDMVLTQAGAPMESAPEIWSLFGPRENRRYQILLNDAKDSFFDPILLRSLPFDAQVGILAHELGHVVYYQELNIFEFGKWGLMYLRDDDFRASHERTTDLMPVYHGLGSQIYQYAYFVRYDPSCKAFFAEEKDFMDKYYLTDKELLDLIQK